MKKHINGGKSNISGVNAQVLASMSLFLQSLNDPKFLYIHLEAPKFQDFNLVYNDEKKLICEVKNWERALNYSDLKQILQKIIAKKSLSEKDEILIICCKVNNKLISAIRNMSFLNKVQNVFRDKNYTDMQIEILPKVKFWEITPDLNEKIIYYLFADFISFWIPPEDIERIVDSILYKKMYKGAAKGSIYRKDDIIKEINSLADEVKENSVTHYDNKLQTKQKQFANLKTALKNPQHMIWNVPKELSGFSTDYERLAFAFKELKNEDGLDLAKWEPLWKLNRLFYFSSNILNIFENNIHSEENRRYILDYINENIKLPRNFYQEDFFVYHAIRILRKFIINKYKNYFNDIFCIIRKLLTNKEKSFYLFFDSNVNRHEKLDKTEISSFLYAFYMTANKELKQKLVELLLTNFNIIEDCGQFYNHSPKEIFEIIFTWLDESVACNFKKIITAIVNQHDEFYKKYTTKKQFNGIEIIGQSCSYWESDYHVTDQHFVVDILEPAIKNYYQNSHSKCWEFIIQKCISDDNQISRERPDFLNRSVYKIVLERYSNHDSKISVEAFAILKKFILSEKGIPSKASLIYQAIAKEDIIKLSDDEKWQLVKFNIDENNIPLDSFTQKIIANLAKKNFPSAKETVRKWFKDKNYYRQPMFGQDAISTIKIFIDSDFNFAVELFKYLLEYNYSQPERINDLSSFLIAELLYDIMLRNYGEALKIIRYLEEKGSLPVDLQIIYGHSLFNDRGDDNSDEINLLMKVYTDIIDPFLNKMGNNISNICNRINISHAREAFVKFAERLAAKKKIPEALRIVKVFVQDPDPKQESLRIIEGKMPSTIESIRGRCGWVLMKCAVLEGREYINEIIELTEKLIFEDNKYVVHMACYALSQLAKNRLKVLPTNKNILFLNDDIEQALIMSKKIEKIAFNLLDKFSTWQEKIQEAMSNSILHVFDPIRALNEKDASHLVNMLIHFPKKVINDAAALFIYYAEFRKENYKGWEFKSPGLYDDLEPDKFNDKKFKEILNKIISNIQKYDPNLCFEFAAQISGCMAHGLETGVAIKYFQILTNVYSHSIFNHLIYSIIQTEIAKHDKYLMQWYELLIKCLKIEKKYYESKIKEGNGNEIRWYVSMSTKNVLEVVYYEIGEEKFLDATETFFSFPEEVILHESENLVNIIKQIKQTNNNQKAQKLLKILYERDPAKYHDSMQKEGY